LKAHKISKPQQLEVYVVVADYRKQEKGEVTLTVGMLVEVVEKTETGRLPPLLDRSFCGSQRSFLKLSTYRSRSNQSSTVSL